MEDLTLKFKREFLTKAFQALGRALSMLFLEVHWTVEHALATICYIFFCPLWVIWRSLLWHLCLYLEHRASVIKE